MSRSAGRPERRRAAVSILTAMPNAVRIGAAARLERDPGFSGWVLCREAGVVCAETDPQRFRSAKPIRKKGVGFITRGRTMDKDTEHEQYLRLGKWSE